MRLLYHISYLIYFNSAYKLHHLEIEYFFIFSAHAFKSHSFILHSQAAVPKYLKLEMLPASSSVIPPHSNGLVTQEIRVLNSMHGEKNIMLKLKIGYSQGGALVSFEIFL